jgi:2-dehydropantoate 2-reductase
LPRTRERGIIRGQAKGEDVMERPRILLMGCGGLGGVMAASLFERGHDVVAVTHNDAITAAINAHGVAVRSDDERRVVSGLVSSAIPADAGLFDFVLLATQPPQAVEATVAALPFLRGDGAIAAPSVPSSPGALP